MNKSLLPLLLLASLPACVDAPLDEDVDHTGGDGEAPLFAGPLEGKQNNGPYLLGKGTDTLGAGGHIRVANAARRGINNVTINVVDSQLQNGNATRTGADPWFIGVVFDTPSGGQIKIDNVFTSPLAWLSWYQLSYKPPGGSSFGAYCGNGGRATPIAGSYTTDDVRQDTANITFSCEDGVVAKCSAASFKPGDDLSNLHWKKHQACVQALEFDVCGDGQAHTYAGTEIYLRDLSPGGAPQLVEADLVFASMTPTPPPPTVPYFEAAWLAPTLVTQPVPQIGTEPPACLSKIRWQSQPPGGACGAADPRISDGADFCEDWTWDELTSGSGGVVFTKSKFGDIGLWVWNDASGRVHTTVDGFWSALPLHLEEPVAGYTTATLDAVILRAVPPGFTAGDVHEVRLFHNPQTQRYVLANVAPPGYQAFGGFQGLVFNQHQPTLGTVPLIRWVNGTDTRTSVTQPLGFNQAETLGWVFPPR